MKTVLPAVSSSQLSGVSSVAEARARVARRTAVDLNCVDVWSCGEEGGEGKADESGPGGLENAVEEEVFTLKVTASKVRKSC